MEGRILGSSRIKWLISTHMSQTAALVLLGIEGKVPFLLFQTALALVVIFECNRLETRPCSPLGIHWHAHTYTLL